MAVAITIRPASAADCAVVADLAVVNEMFAQDEPGDFLAAFISHVEQLLREAGDEVARVLIVETSSTDQYAATRASYTARGFDEEAHIRDYYGPGDCKVVFWKSLLEQ